MSVNDCILAVIDLGDGKIIPGHETGSHHPHQD